MYIIQTSYMSTVGACVEFSPTGCMWSPDTPAKLRTPTTNRTLRRDTLSQRLRERYQFVFPDSVDGHDIHYDTIGSLLLNGLVTQ
jgi:hypothetical protein